jgi:hypothetical protein
MPWGRMPQHGYVTAVSILKQPPHGDFSFRSETATWIQKPEVVYVE